MEIGLLLLRVVLGLILFTHAAQKLFGWFSGNGLTKQGAIFASLGLRPGRVMVGMAGVAELVAALLLVLGLFTPVAALLAASTMLVAALTMHLNSGKFWNIAGGGEYPYVLTAAAAVLAFTGAGSYALDAVIFSESDALYSLLAVPEPWVGGVVIALAVIAAVPFAAVVKKNKAKA